MIRNREREQQKAKKKGTFTRECMLRCVDAIDSDWKTSHAINN